MPEPRYNFTAPPHFSTHINHDRRRRQTGPDGKLICPEKVTTRSTTLSLQRGPALFFYGAFRAFQSGSNLLFQIISVVSLKTTWYSAFNIPTSDEYDSKKDGGDTIFEVVDLVPYIPHLFLLLLDNLKAIFGYGTVKTCGFIPNAFKYFSCTSSSGLASFRWFPALITRILRNLVLIINAVGLLVTRPLQPGWAFPVFST